MLVAYRLQDENLDIIYINGEQAQNQWTTYEVGKTRLNDEALRQTGKPTIDCELCFPRRWRSNTIFLYTQPKWSFII
jgi:hypothetical protein